MFVRLLVGVQTQLDAATDVDVAARRGDDVRLPALARPEVSVLGEGDANILTLVLDLEAILLEDHSHVRNTNLSYKLTLMSL